MSTTHSFQLVVLDEDEVPGAKLPNADVASNSVVALRRWLETRGLATNGNKSALIERVSDVIDKGLPINVAIDGGTYYKKKADALAASYPPEKSLKPPLPPVQGWNPFPSVSLPEYFCQAQIYQYIVLSATVVGMNINIQTDRQLDRGLEFFKSGHVHNMQDCLVGGFYFCKAQVRASYENGYYDVLVSIDPKTGMVQDGSCDCKASAMGRCSHVSGLLHAVADCLKQFGVEACTSKTCQWNQGRKTLRSPKKLSERHQQEWKRFKTVEYDPRPESTKSDDDIVKDMKDIIQRGQRLSGWSQIFDEAQAPSEKFIYSDYQLSSEREQVLKLQRKLFQKSLEPASNSNGPVEIVKNQHSNEWKQQRCIRITASNCKAVKTAQKATTKSNLVNQILWTTTIVNTPSMQYGIDNEPCALRVYADHLKTQDPSLSIHPTGLWINSECPELGCSPDGIIKNDRGELVGLVEVKCPKLLEFTKVDSFDDVLKAKQKQTFCLQVQPDGSIRLKPSHRYFYQVQMQMGVMGVPWCDFVVWSPHSYLIRRIFFCCDFWKTLKESLIRFHHEYLVPEYFELRICRGLTAFCVPDSHL